MANLTAQTNVSVMNASSNIMPATAFQNDGELTQCPHSSIVAQRSASASTLHLPECIQTPDAQLTCFHPPDELQNSPSPKTLSRLRSKLKKWTGTERSPKQSTFDLVENKGSPRRLGRRDSLRSIFGSISSNRRIKKENEYPDQQRTASFVQKGRHQDDPHGIARRKSAGDLFRTLTSRGSRYATITGRDVGRGTISRLDTNNGNLDFGSLPGVPVSGNSNDINLQNTKNDVSKTNSISSSLVAILSRHGGDSTQEEPPRYMYTEGNNSNNSHINWVHWTNEDETQPQPESADNLTLDSERGNIEIEPYQTVRWPRVTVKQVSSIDNESLLSKDEPLFPSYDTADINRGFHDHSEDRAVDQGTLQERPNIEKAAAESKDDMIERTLAIMTKNRYLASPGANIRPDLEDALASIEVGKQIMTQTAPYIKRPDPLWDGQEVTLLNVQNQILAETLELRSPPETASSHLRLSPASLARFQTVDLSGYDISDETPHSSFLKGSFEHVENVSEEADWLLRTHRCWFSEPTVRSGSPIAAGEYSRQCHLYTPDSITDSEESRSEESSRIPTIPDFSELNSASLPTGSANFHQALEQERPDSAHSRILDDFGLSIDEFSEFDEKFDVSDTFDAQELRRNSADALILSASDMEAEAAMPVRTWIEMSKAISQKPENLNRSAEKEVLVPEPIDRSAPSSRVTANIPPTQQFDEDVGGLSDVYKSGSTISLPDGFEFTSYAASMSEERRSQELSIDGLDEPSTSERTAPFISFSEHLKLFLGKENEADCEKLPAYQIVNELDKKATASLVRLYQVQGILPPGLTPLLKRPGNVTTPDTCTATPNDTKHTLHVSGSVSPPPAGRIARKPVAK